MCTNWNGISGHTSSANFKEYAYNTCDASHKHEFVVATLGTIVLFAAMQSDYTLHTHGATDIHKANLFNSYFL